MSDLRTAAQQALEALEGWENHDRWVWPESALEQAKRNTTESLAALRAALAQQAEPNPDYPCRSDGRCQYAIDHGAEGLGSCPKGKCAIAQPQPAEDRAVAQDNLRVMREMFGEQTEPVEPVEPVSNEALRLAGLALIGLAEHDQHCDVFDLDDQGRHKACTCGLNDAIAVITQAGKSAPPQQAEPVQEPVGEILPNWSTEQERIVGTWAYLNDLGTNLPVGTKLYTAPPQRLPLTEEVISRLCDEYQSPRQLARAVERAHGIKE